MVNWKMLYLFQGCILRFQPLIFQGVYNGRNHTAFDVDWIRELAHLGATEMLPAMQDHKAHASKANEGEIITQAHFGL